MEQKGLSINENIIPKESSSFIKVNSFKSLKKTKIKRKDFKNKKDKKNKEVKFLLTKNKALSNTKLFNRKYMKYSLLFFFISLIIIAIIFFIYIFSKREKNYYKENIEKGDIIPINPLILKDSEQEYKDCQEYFSMIKNGTLYNKDKIYKLSNNPKISVVIAVHNGEGFIKEAVISIQNQDFKDLEIIIINDYSTDNSADVIKELMKTEPRIRFYQNEENRGAFYTKTKGILLAKGKYVLSLDDDDKNLQRDAFTTLYEEAEKNNLDILRFNFISNYGLPNRGSYNHNNNSEPIITQPELSNLMLFKGEDGKIHQNFGILWNQIFRTDLFIKVINQIDKKYLMKR